MNKAVDVILSENTNIIIRISTIITIILATATIIYTFSTIKGDIELSVNTLQQADIRIEEKFDNSVSVLECVDDDIIAEQKEQSLLISEVQSSQSDIKASLARIEANNVWIISALKNE